MALDSWFQLRYKSVRAAKEESEAGMPPRSSLKCKKRPESAESSDNASGRNPDNARPCNEILVTLPAAPTPHNQPISFLNSLFPEKTNQRKFSDA